MTKRTDADRDEPLARQETPNADPAGAENVAILDTLDVPIVVVGRDCTLVRFNRAAKEALLLAPSDVGRRLGAIEALGIVKDVEQTCARVMADEAACRRDVRSGDRWFVLRICPHAAPAGEVAGAVLTFTNVTAFRASVEQAIYEREYTKAILNTVASPLVVLDAQLRVQSGNRAFYSMFGVSREAAQALPLRDLGDDAWKTSALWTSLKAVLSGADDFQPLEIDRDFPGIGRRTILLDARRVAREGEATLLLAVQDVTERKRTEQQLQEADRRKDEFLALLAHELRNPLAPIRTGLELIRISGDNPESMRRLRSMMERQVNQMVRLIDDLMDVSRIASGKLVLQRSPISVAELVQAAIESQRVSIENAKLELTVDLPAGECAVDADAARFTQILSNVLHNACKFTPPPGKIHCAVEVLDGPVRQVAITISDTGIGIAKEMLPRVFELFTQAESATVRAHGGLGIGLALARRLIEMHGGLITVRSDGPGQGSAFVITMPVCGAIAPPAPRPSLDAPQLACRVVIVDDNRDAANTMSMLIEEMGGSTRVAHDAPSGLEVVRQFEPNVVLMDIGMPGIDGYQACRQIRRDSSNKQVVIVAITGWGQPLDKQRAFDAGFDVHLTKPVDRTALAHVLGGNAPGPST